MYNGKTLNETMDAVLGDMSLIVKTKVMGMDPKEIALLHTTGDTKIGQALMADDCKFMSLAVSEYPNDADSNKNYGGLSQRSAAESVADMFSNRSSTQKKQDKPGVTAPAQLEVIPEEQPKKKENQDQILVKAQDMQK